MTSGFSVERLAATLNAVRGVSGFCIGFSGGRDSTVLLHAVAGCRDQLDVPLTAVHVNHGLHPAAHDWARHCHRVCSALAIPLTCLKVDARPPPGTSPEAAARDARYNAVAEVLGDGEALLTAHHRDDQAETLLLQLLRGAGPRGLAAMPADAPFARGRLLRPLLDVDRAELASWAEQQGLDWIDDPSNDEHGPDRNYLRHRVLPLLQQRWPSATSTLSRAAAHQADASDLLQELADLDLTTLMADDGTLDLAGITALSRPRQRNLLRGWLQHHGLRTPAAKVLERVFTELTPARLDAAPAIVWPGGELRRYRGRLHALPHPRALPDPEPRHWDLQQPLPFGDGQLVAERVIGRGLRASACHDGVTVTLRQGGERCRPHNNPHHRDLKTLLQQAGVPPWERQRLALISIENRVAQVVGLCIDYDWTAEAGEPGIVIRLTGPPQAQD